MVDSAGSLAILTIQLFDLLEVFGVWIKIRKKNHRNRV